MEKHRHHQVPSQAMNLTRNWIFPPRIAIAIDAPTEAEAAEAEAEAAGAAESTAGAAAVIGVTAEAAAIAVAVAAAINHPSRAQGVGRTPGLPATPLPPPLHRRPHRQGEAEGGGPPHGTVTVALRCPLPLPPTTDAPGAAFIKDCPVASGTLCWLGRLPRRSFSAGNSCHR